MKALRHLQTPPNKRLRATISYRLSRLEKAVIRLVLAVNDAFERGLAAREWNDSDAELRAQTRGVYVLIGLVFTVVAIEFAVHHPIANLFSSNR